MADGRRKEVMMEIAVGAFIALILLGLAIFTIVISEQSLFKKYHEYTVFFDDISGLRPNETVYSRGLMVGKVTETAFVNQGDTQGVNVKMRLDHPLKLREGHRIQIKDSSLLGGKRIVVEEGAKDQPLLDDAGYKTLVGAPTGDLIEEATAMVQDVREAVLGSEILPNVQRFTDDLVDVSGAIVSGTGTVSKLIYDDKLYDSASRIANNVEIAAYKVANEEGVIGELLSADSELTTKIKGTVDNLDGSLANVRDLTDKVKAGEGLVGDLFNPDSPLRANVLATSESVKTLTDNLNNSQGTIGRLINDPALYDEALATARSVTQTSDSIGAGVDTFKETARSITRTSDRIGGSMDTVDQTVRSFNRTAESITKTSDSVGDVIASVQRGEGSLGKLVSDPELYDKATGLVDDVRATVDDLRETSPITTFSSIFFGAF